MLIYMCVSFLSVPSVWKAQFELHPISFLGVTKALGEMTPRSTAWCS